MADSKRARSWKRRTLPRIDLTNDEPVLYSTQADRDVVKIVVACCQIVNPKLFHSRDNQGIVGEKPVPRSDSLSAVQPSFVRHQHEHVQTKDSRCLRPVLCQLSDFAPFAS